jgi:hypothetical protein
MSARIGSFWYSTDAWVKQSRSGRDASRTDTYAALGPHAEQVVELGGSPTFSMDESPTVSLTGGP